MWHVYYVVYVLFDRQLRFFTIFRLIVKQIWKISPATIRLRSSSLKQLQAARNRFNQSVTNGVLQKQCISRKSYCCTCPRIWNTVFIQRKRASKRLDESEQIRVRRTWACLQTRIDCRSRFLFQAPIRTQTILITELVTATYDMLHIFRFTYNKLLTKSWGRIIYELYTE